MIKHISLLTPIYITLFWGLILFIQPGKTDRAKIYLGIFMFCAFLLYCTHVVFFSNLYKIYSYIEGIYIFTLLSVYPMFYLYLIYLTSHKIVFNREILHFIPAFILGVLSLIMTFILSTEERIIYVKEILIGKNLKDLDFTTLVGFKGLIFFLSRILFITQVATYAILGIRIINIHNKRILNYYSNTDGKTLDWIRILSIFFLFVATASITLSFIGRSSFIGNEVWLLIPSGIFSLFLFIIGFKGNQQVNFNFDITEEEEPLSNDKSGQKDILKKKLILLFTEDRIFINPDLRITTVSEALKTNRTYISRLINEEFKMNFNEFVNNYRVEEAKQLLLESDNDLYSMEYIAEKSGFGSINSFTRVFKNVVGLTPGSFRTKN